jgi:hypothetical protein
VLKDGEDASEEDECDGDFVDRKTTCAKVFFLKGFGGIIPASEVLVAEKERGETKASVAMLSVLLYASKIKRPSIP